MNKQQRKALLDVAAGANEQCENDTFAETMTSRQDAGADVPELLEVEHRLFKASRDDSDS